MRAVRSGVLRELGPTNRGKPLGGFTDGSMLSDRHPRPTPETNRRPHPLSPMLILSPPCPRMSVLGLWDHWAHKGTRDTGGNDPSHATPEPRPIRHRRVALLGSERIVIRTWQPSIEIVAGMKVTLLDACRTRCRVNRPCWGGTSNIQIRPCFGTAWGGVVVSDETFFRGRLSCSARLDLQDTERVVIGHALT